MEIKVKNLFSKTTLALLFSILLFNCNLDNNLNNNSLTNKNYLLKKTSKNSYDIDLSNGKYTKDINSFKVKVPLNNTFSTKALTSRNNVSEVKSIALYLTTNKDYTAVNSGGYTYKFILDIEPSNTSSYEFNFKNITTSGNFYVAAQAFDNINGTGNNITKFFSNASGTITMSAGNVTGTGGTTFFTKELGVGERIIVKGESFLITNITNDTTMTVASNKTIASPTSFSVSPAPASGQITISGNNVTGTGTKFNTELASSKRIFVNGNQYNINTITNDFNATILESTTISTPVNFKADYSINTPRFVLSDNTINVDSSLVVTGTSIDIPLELTHNEGLIAEYPIHNSTNLNSLKNLDISTDNEGNGFLFWQNTTAGNNVLEYANLKEYLPSPRPNFPNPSNVAQNRTVTNPLDALSLSYIPVKQKGLVSFTSTVGGPPTRNIRALKIGSSTLGVPDVPDFALTNLFANQNARNPHTFINLDGNGMVVFSADKSNVLESDAGVNGNSSIFGVKINNYHDLVPSSFQPLFFNNNNIKENPKIALNYNGDGYITWQELIGSGYDIFAMPISKYEQPISSGTIVAGTISIDNLGNVTTGGTAKFKLELEVGSRIIDGATGNEYYVSSITNNNTATVSNPPVSTINITSLNFKIKGGRKILPQTTNALYNSGATSLTLNASPTELSAGMRIKVYDSNVPPNFVEDLIVSSVSTNIVNLLRPTVSSCTPPCTIVYKSDLMLNTDAVNNPGDDSILPNIKMDNSGRAMVVWKERNGSAPHFIKGRKISLLNLANGFTFANLSLPTSEILFHNDSTGSILGAFSDNYPPTLTLNNNGNGLVAWFMQGSGGPIPRSVHYKQFNNYGSSLGSLFMLNHKNPAKTMPEKQYYPVLSLNNQGNGILAFIDNPNSGIDRIVARNFRTELFSPLTYDEY
ncbi:MAG: hypothetical protein U0457_15115 [Candidatus Sericytochromatia bacterium]